MKQKNPNVWNTLDRTWKSQERFKRNSMDTMQIKSWEYMFQTSENYNNIQEPTNKENLQDFSQHKL